VQSPYEGNIGADGNPLQLFSKRFMHHGSGSVFYKPVHNVAFASHIVVDSPNLQDAFHVVPGGDSSSDYLYVRRGTAFIQDGSAAWLRIIVASTGWGTPRLTIGSGVGQVWEYYQSAGEVNTKSALGATTGMCLIAGGTLIYDYTGTVAWNGRISIANGGRFILNGTGGTGVVIVHSGGTLDMMQDRRAKTLGTVIIMPGGNFFTHSNITVTTLIDLRPQDPIIPDHPI
jgi:hypothetical protein